MEEFSTRSRILDAVDSSNSLVVRILRTPLKLMHPLITSSPTRTVLGTLSPVRALVLRELLPAVTMPSMGIFSPGETCMMLPTSTSSGSTFWTSSSSTRLA